MNRTKIIISIRVVSMLLCLLCTFTVRASIGDVFRVDGLNYTITCESPVRTVEVKKWSSTKPSGTLTIPKSVINEDKEYAITGIGYPAFYTCSGLVSVEIPYGVSVIGVQAFQGCSALPSISIPYSVTTIDEIAFYDCSSMTTVVMGSGLTSIASDAFKNCEAVTDVFCYADTSKLTWDLHGHSNFSRLMTNFHVFDTSA